MIQSLCGTKILKTRNFGVTLFFDVRLESGEKFITFKGRQVRWIDCGQIDAKQLGGGFKAFLFSALPGEMMKFDEHIFQMGWNHQPDNWWERQSWTSAPDFIRMHWTSFWKSPFYHHFRLVIFHVAMEKNKFFKSKFPYVHSIYMYGKMSIQFGWYGKMYVTIQSSHGSNLIYIFWKLVQILLASRLQRLSPLLSLLTASQHWFFSMCLGNSRILDSSERGWYCWWKKSCTTWDG